MVNSAVTARPKYAISEGIAERSGFSAVVSGSIAGMDGSVATSTTKEAMTSDPSDQVAPRHPMRSPMNATDGEPATSAIVDPIDTTATAWPVWPLPPRRAAIGLTSDQNNPWVNAAVTRAMTNTA